MVNFDKIKNGLAKYLDNEIIPNLSDKESERFLAGIVSGIFIKRLDNIANSYLKNPIIQAAGVINNKGELDIDLIYEVAKEQIKTKALSIDLPVFGKLTFTRDDIETLYKYIIE